MNRHQRRHQPSLSLSEIRAQVRAELVAEMNAIIEQNTHQLIDGMLLAMNSELKIGTVRGQRVVNKANELIQSMSPEELHKLALEKMF